MIKLNYSKGGKYIDEKMIDKEKLLNEHANIKFINFAEDDLEGLLIILNKRKKILAKLKEYNFSGKPNSDKLMDFINNFNSYDTFITKIVRYLFNIKRLAELRQKWQKKHDVEYDVIIKWRPDMVISKLDFANYNKNNFYICGDYTSLENDKWLGDVTFYGSPNIINKVMKSLFDEYLENPIMFDKIGLSNYLTFPEKILGVILKHILKVPKESLKSIFTNYYPEIHFIGDCKKKFGTYCSNCEMIMIKCREDSDLKNFLESKGMSIYDLNYFSITKSLRCINCSTFHEIL
jgi:hypothetical protein